MTLSSASVIEVRATGNDTNGGAFVTGASGTDFSQQDSKNTVGNNISTTDAVSNGTTTLTSATAAFTSAIVGNIVYLTGGSGSLAAGYYQVVTFTNATTVVLDRLVASGTGITLNIGGALATPTQALLYFIGGNGVASVSVGGFIIYIKAAVYSISTTMNVGSNTDISTGLTRIVGYTTTRGDKGKATFQLAVDSITIMNWTHNQQNNIYTFENIIWDGNNHTASSGFAQGWQVIFYKCIFQNFKGTPLNTNSGDTFGGSVLFCDFINNALSSTLTYCIQGESFISIYGCYFAGNSSSGTNSNGCIIINEQTSVTSCIFYNNTGTNFDGIINAGSNFCFAQITNNIFHGTGHNSINAQDGCTGAIINNIFTNNGRAIAMGGQNPTTSVFMSVTNNAYFGNTSGNQLGFVSGGNDVILTGLPYVSAGTNFALNNTAGQGAACKAAGIPGLIGAGTLTAGSGFLDIGALQSQSAVSMSGGFA